MFLFGLILGAVLGIAAGWGVSYLWFKRAKIATKEAGKIVTGAS